MPLTPVDEEQNPQGHDVKDRTRTILFGGVVIVGLAAFIFGLISLKTSIAAPFRLSRATNADATNLGPTGDLLTTLRSKDTDNDTLSDYDELYGYNTSPYLADSDSDGLTDSQEVQQGSDPNCPAGQTCSFAASDTTSATNTDSAILDLLNTSGTAGTNTDALTVEELRTTLKNAGAPAATIDAIDDETLLSLYQEVVTEAGGAETLNTTTNNEQPTTNNLQPTTNNAETSTTNTVANTNNSVINGDGNSAANTTTNTSSQTTVDATTLENLTPDQIRQFLREGGADDAALQQIDDATLNSIFQEALQSLSSSSN